MPDMQGAVQAVQISVGAPLFVREGLGVEGPWGGGRE